MRTLESLATIHLPASPTEVIVVDNGDRDSGAALVVSAIRERAPRFRWRYIHEATPGLLAGRHRGATESRGDICVFVDDDVHFSRDWLVAILDAFRDPTAGLVGGPSKAIYEARPPEWLRLFFHVCPFGVECGYLSLFDGGKGTREIDPCYIWGLNYAIRRDLLFRIGGFNPDNMPLPLLRYQGDGETGLSLKVRDAGIRCLYCEDAAIEHRVPARRLTPEYFEFRARVQGIVDSFTQIRSGNRDASPSSRSWRAPLRWCRRFVDEISRRANGVGDIAWRASFSYHRGFAFHQREVRNDPELLAWVMRENYWDYSLPAGWERYVRNGKGSRPAARRSVRLGAPPWSGQPREQLEIAGSDSSGAN